MKVDPPSSLSVYCTVVAADGGQRRVFPVGRGATLAGGVSLCRSRPRCRFIYGSGMKVDPPLSLSLYCTVDSLKITVVQKYM